MTSEESIEISSGPGKFDLMVSLFSVEPPGGYMPVVFNGELHVVITMISREDPHSREENWWLFEGHILGTISLDLGYNHIKGRYSTKTRKGLYSPIGRRVTTS